MASITINLMNVTLYGTNCAILLNGGSYDLNTRDPLSISGTVNFSSLSVTAGAIDFYVANGTAFNATISASVVSNAQGTAPQIEVTNFSGMATVTWPTNTGMDTQALMAGDPVALSGYVA